MNGRYLTISTALVFMFAGVVRTANAGGPKAFKCSSSGSGVDIPIDLDSDSCFPAANGATVCTDFSAHSDYAGHCSPGGEFTGKNLVEYVSVPGTGCNFFGTVLDFIASCTLADSSEQGCVFQSSQGSAITRDNNGDLTFSTVSVTICEDFSSGPPFNFTGTFETTITGGTGRSAGATGSSSGTLHGQHLTFDAAFHGFSWFESNWTGTITTP